MNARNKIKIDDTFTTTYYIAGDKLPTGPEDNTNQLITAEDERRLERNAFERRSTLQETETHQNEKVNFWSQALEAIVACRMLRINAKSFCTSFGLNVRRHTNSI